MLAWCRQKREGHRTPSVQIQNIGKHRACTNLDLFLSYCRKGRGAATPLFQTEPVSCLSNTSGGIRGSKLLLKHAFGIAAQAKSPISAPQASLYMIWTPRAVVKMSLKPPTSELGVQAWAEYGLDSWNTRRRSHAPRKDMRW